MGYISIIPILDTAHVDATSIQSDLYLPYFAFDTARSLTGVSESNSWRSLQNNKKYQRIWCDLSASYVINRLYYQNFHHRGGSTYDGAYEGSIWGSNIRPEAYEVYEGLVQLWSGNFGQHVKSDISDPLYITFSNTTAYRYYIVDIDNNYAGNFGIGFRRLTWQEQVSSSSSSSNSSSSSSSSSSSLSSSSSSSSP